MNPISKHHSDFSPSQTAEVTIVQILQRLISITYPGELTLLVGFFFFFTSHVGMQIVAKHCVCLKQTAVYTFFWCAH